jgi:hypothetical protein
MEATFRILLLAVVIVAVIGLISWHFSRSRAILQRWADEHGFEILHCEYRHLAHGPFFWTTSRHQTVYYVSVRDPQGAERKGWVRCGGWFFGLMTDKAEARWEDER